MALRGLEAYEIKNEVFFFLLNYGIDNRTNIISVLNNNPQLDRSDFINLLLELNTQKFIVFSIQGIIDQDIFFGTSPLEASLTQKGYEFINSHLLTQSIMALNKSSMRTNKYQRIILVLTIIVASLSLFVTAINVWLTFSSESKLEKRIQTLQLQVSKLQQGRTRGESRKPYPVDSLHKH